MGWDGIGWVRWDGGRMAWWYGMVGWWDGMVGWDGGMRWDRGMVEILLLPWLVSGWSIKSPPPRPRTPAAPSQEIEIEIYGFQSNHQQLWKSTRGKSREVDASEGKARGGKGRQVKASQGKSSHVSYEHPE